ncbi:MAG: imidazoleglycerol-phosphate dehydratase HisB [Candidatus Nezhaarchaeota archaeon]|nr:imidazoleglycerol-phosphate dehydratase HisB [Candidatus Nezhaarchaeota archaeon]MCX8141310.1 imidazoleglycerol-phosphate dehydratase HisB [Candidatus Nezhaarchaeota archaeon]MDW8049576.1 imidazoleglycerol-phosphate dehydratase HisB [Nitrososphaerota archaeon]
MRRAKVEKKTLETHIEVEVNIDGSGLCEVETGFLLLDHMLRTLAFHSSIDLNVKVIEGDLEHHIAEDIGLALGEAIAKALGEREGIARFGWALVPMDEALALVALDLSSRPSPHIDLGLKDNYVEDMKVEDLEHFLRSMATSARMSMHVKILSGENDHHKVEAVFKAIALALRQAVAISRSGIPSLKGLM